MSIFNWTSYANILTVFQAVKHALQPRTVL